MKKHNVAPAIFTVLSGVGLIATAISSGYAAIKLKEDLKQFDGDVAVKTSDVLKVVAKDVAIPVACAAGTYGCFLAARSFDKKTIAALSAGLGTALPRITSTDEDGNPLIKRKGSNIKPDVIIDENGKLFLEPIADVMIKMSDTTFLLAREAVNRNYQLRGGVASLYEFYRLIGVKKKDIKRLGIDWIKYIGWSYEWVVADGYAWIDMHTSSMNESMPEYDYNYICYNPGLMPICVNPPRVVKDLCHCEVEDIKAANILDGADDIDHYISESICDDGCE